MTQNNPYYIDTFIYDYYWVFIEWNPSQTKFSQF